jgi:Nucleotidyl transferase AbiEii toxin, Type IV TA system
MNELSPVQLRLARVLFELPEANGYALAGGAALILRKVVIRSTRDLDAFIGARPGPDSGTVDELADALAAALRQQGWEVRAARRHPTFCRFVVDCDGETVEVDLAVDSPSLEAPQQVDGIPVLTPLDLAARKVLAIVDRLEARDYTDLHALAALVGQLTCIDAALSMDAGLRKSDIAEAFDRVQRLTDETFPPASDNPASIRGYFTAWANDLAAD